MDGGADAAEEPPEGARLIDTKRAKRAKKAHAERHQVGEAFVGMSKAISSLVATKERAGTYADTEKSVRLPSERSKQFSEYTILCNASKDVLAGNPEKKVKLDESMLNKFMN